MDQEEYQLEFFLKTVKKCLSNLCNNCIDEICDSAVRKVLISKVEPSKKIETYIRLLTEKRNKIECCYRSLFEEASDHGMDELYVSDNNSHFSGSENCGKSHNREVKQNY